MALGVLVCLFFIYSLIAIIQNKDNLLVFVSLLVQLLFWTGINYYQSARYDDTKIVAQFGWPAIRYDDIVSVDAKWGDIIIKSDKRAISIRRNIVDEDSLKEFIDHLNTKMQESDSFNLKNIMK
jgi:hypothetical protein